MPTYIDLFAGCGGLSLGLEKAGFELLLAVEKSPMAAETYYHNFIEPIVNLQDWEEYLSSQIEKQFSTGLIVEELVAVLRNEKIMNHLRHTEVDLVVGGPPCQGFSLAGRRDPTDERNQLPWQFLDFVEAVMPKAVLMENVIGMNRNFSKHDTKAPFELLQIELSKLGIGYDVQPVELNAMHYGIPQHRPRVMLLAVRKGITSNRKELFSQNIWKSEHERDSLLIRPKIVPKITHFGQIIRRVRDAFWDIDDNGYIDNELNEYTKIMRSPECWSFARNRHIHTLPNHNLRNHTSRVTSRFRLYQYLVSQGISPNTVNIPSKKNLEYEDKISILQSIYDGVDLPALSPDEEKIGNTIDELIELTFALKTKKHSQRPLDLLKPSPTILSIPDDFVHPTSPRTLTVREMARLQSFPDAFEFRSKETTGSKRRKFEVPQYTQVGNAVPPLLAFHIGKNFAHILEHSKDMINIS
ncbi:MAG: DNA cytosine methyltransferase [Chloroflexota bacterium]